MLLSTSSLVLFFIFSFLWIQWYILCIICSRQWFKFLGSIHTHARPSTLMSNHFQVYDPKSTETHTYPAKIHILYSLCTLQNTSTNGEWDVHTHTHTHICIGGRKRAKIFHLQCGEAKTLVKLLTFCFY